MIIKTGNEILILTKEDNTLLLPLTYLPGQYRIRVAALASDQNTDYWVLRPPHRRVELCSKKSGTCFRVEEVN